jgi:hypothetical protein
LSYPDGSKLTLTGFSSFELPSFDFPSSFYTQGGMRNIGWKLNKTHTHTHVRTYTIPEIMADEYKHVIPPIKLMAHTFSLLLESRVFTLSLLDGFLAPLLTEEYDFLLSITFPPLSFAGT